MNCSSCGVIIEGATAIFDFAYLLAARTPDHKRRVVPYSLIDRLSETSSDALRVCANCCSDRERAGRAREAALEKYGFSAEALDTFRKAIALLSSFGHPLDCLDLGPAGSSRFFLIEIGDNPYLQSHIPGPGGHSQLALENLVARLPVSTYVWEGEGCYHHHTVCCPFVSGARSVELTECMLYEIDIATGHSADCGLYYEREGLESKRTVEHRRLWGYSAVGGIEAARKRD